MQPVRKENSSNYKYDFPETWLGLEKEALQEATGLSDVSFCHKGGFLLTAETLDDAVAACRISLAGMPKAPVLIHIGTDAIDADDALLRLGSLIIRVSDVTNSCICNRLITVHVLIAA